MILEVCVDSYKSLLIAKEAGADRIELCSALNIGGLTPSIGLMKKASQHGDLEIFVMVRPRSGDFLYNEEEFETMKEDVIAIKKLGFDGIVAGFLKADGRIDLERTRELVELAAPLKFVFHRAFDDAKSPVEDMEALIDMGVLRILTSGQRPKALEGADYISRLEKDFGDRIEIMPGSGVSADNILELVRLTGCKSYHMSGKVNIGSAMVYKDYLDRMETFEAEIKVEKADFDRINKVRTLLDNY